MAGGCQADHTLLCCRLSILELMLAISSQLANFRLKLPQNNCGSLRAVFIMQDRVCFAFVNYSFTYTVVVYILSFSLQWSECLTWRSLYKIEAAHCMQRSGKQLMAQLRCCAASCPSLVYCHSAVITGHSLRHHAEWGEAWLAFFSPPPPSCRSGRGPHA